MTELLIVLIAAHLIADFPAQSNWMIARKQNLLFLLAHILIVAVVTIVLLGSFPPILLAILIGTHLAMDAVKVYLLKDTIGSFLLDQVVHIGVIIVLAFAFPATLGQSWWPDILSPEDISIALNLLVITSAVIAAIPAGGILIQKAMQPFSDQLAADEGTGLSGGGKYIGYLERSLIILLVLSGHPEGVGFLIAAKSILRFGEINKSNNRKMSEYIIIGTFMSFGWALLVAFLSKAALQLL